MQWYICVGVLALVLMGVCEGQRGRQGRPTRTPRPDPPGTKPGNNRNGDKFIQPEEEPESVVEIHESIQSITEPQDLDGNPMSPTPDRMRLEFELKAQPMTLFLKRNNHISPDSPVIVAKGRKMKKWKPNNKKSFSVYTDTSKEASIIMESIMKPTGEEIREFRGSFQYDGDEYVIEPVPTLRSRRKRQAQGQGQDRGQGQSQGQGHGFGKIKHMVYKKKKVARKEKYASLSRGDSAIIDSVKSIRQEASRLQSAPKELKAQHGVEMLMLIDHALYEKWYALSEGETAEQREENTLYSIQYYYSHVANGVDMRYTSIDDDSDFGIYVALAGMHVATTPDAAPFARDNRQDGTPRGRLMSEATLLAMADWLQTNKGDLPRFDQATLYTGDYLIGLYNDRILGLAFIGDICTKYAVSVNRDLGQYSAVQTTAHEMGHNLKALHDGRDNACLTTDQYIMATNPQELTNTLYRNAFTFSTCSRSEMKSHLNWLTGQGTNCLLDMAVPGSGDWNQTISGLPGQRYTPTQQCQLVYGEESYYCGGATEDANICRQMECFHPINRNCYVTFEQRAATGTTCGDKKWCQGGDCVVDEDAPNAPDYCTYGDYTGPYKNGLSCKKIIEEEPWNCYSDYYRDDCCHSCGEMKDESKPGCEYGDRAGDCDSVTPAQCASDRNITERCCKTCFQAACPVSDAPWCTDYIKSARDCYFTSDTCCRTCQPHKTNISGCEYGDRELWCGEEATLDCTDSYLRERCCAKCHQQTTSTTTTSATIPTTDKPTTVSVETCKDLASWCPDVPASSCYVVNDTCCETCSKYYMPVAECEYGDHYTWCKPQYCTTASLKQECCVTCMIVSMTTTTLPSTTTSTVSTTVEGIQPAIPKVCPGPDQADYCSTSPQHNCYVYEDVCCETCTAKHFTGVKGCEYGDRVGWCVDHIKKAADCLPLLSDCCWTCRLYGISPSSSASTPKTTEPAKTTPLLTSLATVTPTPGLQPACSGPDLAEWCVNDSELKQGDCYLVADSCCESCLSKQWTGIKGCEFGDKASWCDKYITGATSCYTEGTTCCNLCRKYNTGVPGCEYGDRRSGCTESDCKTPEIAAECCQSCNVRPPPPPTPTTTVALATITKTQVISPNCEDRAGWCPTIAPSDCYLDDYNKNTCCQTCAMLYRPGMMGCEYGDKRRWCATLDLSRCPDNMDECCDKCKDVQG